MELLDRYLEAVKKYLPWQRQDDIVAELRANLESQLEDKEEELGRPLTSDEAAQWVKQLGPPIHMAARYQPQRSVIGPALYPFYMYVLRLVCSWALAIYSIVMTVQAFVELAPPATALLHALLHAPEVLLTTVAWVTLAFAAIEFCSGRYPEAFKNTPLAGNAWSPASLPPVANTSSSGKKIGNYPRAVAEVIIGYILLVWLLLVPQYPYLLLGPGVAYLDAFPFQAAPVLVLFYWAVVAFNLVQLVWRTVSLWQGRWRVEHPLRDLVFKAVGLIPALILVAAPDHIFIALKHPALDGLHYGATLDTTNQTIYKAMCLVCAIVVLQLLWETGKQILGIYRKRVAAM
jgi:hypothetical protein